MRYFYSHLIKIDQVIVELDSFGFSETDRHHLAQLLDSIIHHTVLDVVLSGLPEKDRGVFWEKFGHDPEDDTLFDFLTFKVEGIEEEVKKITEQLIEEFHQDIKEACR